MPRKETLNLKQICKIRSFLFNLPEWTTTVDDGIPVRDRLVKIGNVKAVGVSRGQKPIILIEFSPDGSYKTRLKKTISKIKSALKAIAKRYGVQVNG